MHYSLRCTRGPRGKQHPKRMRKRHTLRLEPRITVHELSEIQKTCKSFNRWIRTTHHEFQNVSFEGFCYFSEIGIQDDLFTFEPVTVYANHSLRVKLRDTLYGCVYEHIYIINSPYVPDRSGR